MDRWIVDRWIDGKMDRWISMMYCVISIYLSIYPSIYQAEKAIEAQLLKLEAKKQAKGC